MSLPDDGTLERQLRGQVRANPSDAVVLLNLGKLLLRTHRAREAVGPLTNAAAALPDSSAARFSLGSALLAIGKRDEALLRLREALRLDRENFLIRKQIWLIEHPEKFHPEIDWDWQRAQLRKEREQEKRGLPNG